LLRPAAQHKDDAPYVRVVVGEAENGLPYLVRAIEGWQVGGDRWVIWLE